MIASLLLLSSFDIFIPEKTFDAMHEYQVARCNFNPGPLGHAGETLITPVVHCEIRNKNGTFMVRNMTRDGEDYHFGDFDCSKMKCNPSNRFPDINAWRTDKVTLLREASEPYDTFRNLGVVTPLALTTTLSLYKGNVLVARDTYTMRETVNDRKFMNKYFGVDYELWNLDKDIQFKRNGDSLEDVDVTGKKILALASEQERMTVYYFRECLDNYFSCNKSLHCSRYRY